MNPSPGYRGDHQAVNETGYTLEHITTAHKEHIMEIENLALIAEANYRWEYTANRIMARYTSHCHYADAGVRPSIEFTAPSSTTWKLGLKRWLPAGTSIDDQQSDFAILLKASTGRLCALLSG